MVIDDDVTLFGLFARYSEEPEELKKAVIAYASNQAFTSQAEQVMMSPTANLQQQSSGIEEVSKQPLTNTCARISARMTPVETIRYGFNQVL